MIVLKEYQKKAIDQLKEELNYKINRDYKQSTLKAPMGAGKTIIVSSFINQIIEQHDDFIFFWTGIGDGGLIKQNMNKMNTYFPHIKTIALDGESIKALNGQFNSNSVYYISSQMLKSGTKIYEEGDFLGFNNLLENSKNNGKKIILIVDESHIGSDTKEYDKLVKNIEPNFELHVTATPKKKPDTNITLNDVIEEQMIKNSVYVNYLNNFEEEDKSNIVKLAYMKRNLLKKRYENEGSKVNPLVLIQISDSKKGSEELEKIELELKKLGVNEDKIAYFLDKNKKNCENIELIDNEIEFLFFKKAIATGWDCPRSQILVKERLEQKGSSSFDLQVLGRIIRTPELKHYKDEYLNKGYIYTLQESVTILEDFENTNKVNIKTNHNTIKKELDEFTSKIQTTLKWNKILKSKDSINNDENLIKEIFDKEIGAEFGINKKNTNLSEILSGFPCNFNTKIISDEVETKKESYEFKNTSEIKIKDKFINDFSDFIYTICKNEYVPILHPYIVEYLEDYFEKKIDNDTEEDLLLQIKNSILTHEKLKKLISKIIIECKKQEFVKKGREEIVTMESFPIINEATNQQNKCEYTKNVFKIKQALNLNSNEEIFADYLDKNDDVQWWHKNGDNGSNYFSIAYTDTLQNKKKLFYIDFIVCYKDGTFGLFDPKNSTTNNKDKYDALREYSSKNDNISQYGLINAGNENIKILTKKSWSASIEEWELI